MELVSNQKIKWGISSTGRMAQLFVNELQLIGSNIQAVASREYENSRAFCNKNGIPYSCDSIHQVFEYIDILYIPSPNHLHIPISELALQNGVHVLCEKPASLNFEELNSIHSQWLRVY